MRLPKYRAKFYATYVPSHRVGGVTVLHKIAGECGDILDGGWALTKEESEDMLTGLIDKQAKWFDHVAIPVVNLNQKYGVNIFDTTHLISVLVEMKYISFEDAVNCGEEALS